MFGVDHGARIVTPQTERRVNALAMAIPSGDTDLAFLDRSNVQAALVDETRPTAADFRDELLEYLTAQAQIDQPAKVANRLRWPNEVHLQHRWAGGWKCWFCPMWSPWCSSGPAG